ncbi:MAG TPA: ATP-binding protein [Gammaproteobacteria bacterium]|nr:ATP-binding protein [Gammaproteobacteria bacterium]
MSASVAPRSTSAPIGLKSEMSPSTGDISWRILALLNGFRFIIALTLLLTFFLVRDPRIVGEIEPAVAAPVLIAMLAFAIVEHFLIRRRWPDLLLQTYGQFGFDLITIVLLLHTSGGIVSGIGGLLVVSIGTLALLVPLDRALLLASLSTFVLLGEQFLALVRGFTDTADFAATGILAAVIFVITGVVQLLRKQIVETQALAAQRGVDLQNLVELNDYIIQHLRESIVVVDGENRIRLLNESGASLLGVRGDPRNHRLGELAPVLEARLDRWREGAEPLTESTFVMENDQNATRIEPHFARLGGDRHEGVVIFLEDTSLILERVQQTKLAALGRLSASIAHEIRNPLGALSHAGQLLAESENIGADEQRLTDIIRVNSQRVSRIVESVLSLSKNDKTRPQKIELKRWLGDFADEFTKTQELYEDAVSVRGDSLELEAEMDRMHLHQVLWNLCDNAVKYASEAAGAIAVELYCGKLETSGRPYLDVIDSGPGIAPEMVEHIFEPFYTAQPGGTGLGLYISRELCERNGASLRYFSRPKGGSIFRIVFADPNRWQ